MILSLVKTQKATTLMVKLVFAKTLNNGMYNKALGIR